METIIRFSFQLLVLGFLLSSTSHHHHVSARLRRNIQSRSVSESAAASKDFTTFYYPQTLDHFNYKPESYTTFNQRYVINFKYWSGPNTSAPILVFFGAEENLDDDIHGIGFLTDNASRFKALLLYIEVKI